MIDIDRLEYAIRGISSPLTKALNEIEKTKDALKNIRGIDYLTIAYFEGTEHYCWLIEVLLVFNFKNGEKTHIQIHRQSENISKSPKEISKIMESVAQEYKTHRIQFNPNDWELIEDSKFNGRLTRWGHK